MFQQDPREFEDQMEYVPEKVSTNFKYDAASKTVDAAAKKWINK